VASGANEAVVYVHLTGDAGADAYDLLYAPVT
jgi:hypothetical protein